MTATALAIASLALSLLALAYKAGWREKTAEDKAEKLLKDLNGVAANVRMLDQKCCRQHRKIVNAIVVIAPNKAKADEAANLLLDRE